MGNQPERRQESVALETLIQNASGLDSRESIRLADAWAADVLTELQSTGISVVRGLGTFTFTEQGVHFQLDPDFPSVTKFPAVEGFSVALSESAEPDPAPGWTAAAAIAEELESEPDESDVPASQPPESHSGEKALTENEPIESSGSVEESAEGQVESEDLTISPEVPSEKDLSVSASAAWTGLDVSTPPLATETNQQDADVGNVDGRIAENETADNHAAAEQEAATAEEVPVEAHTIVDGDEAAEVSHDVDDVPAAEKSHIEDGDQTAEDSHEVDDVPAAETSHVVDDDDAPSGNEAVAAKPGATSSSPRSRTPRRYERTEHKRSRAALWILGVLVMIIAAALIYRFGVNPNLDDPSFAEEQSPDSALVPGDSLDSAIAAAEDTLQDNAASELPADDIVSSETQESQASEVETAQGRNTTEQAVSDDRIVQGMGGYTLIVGSTMNQQTARGALSQYEALGWPMGILAYESGDMQRYRIAVGHYETAVLADSARNRFADELPEGTWVLSVR